MMATRDGGAGRPPARDILAVFGLGVAGTLIPVAGWLLGVWLVVRASSWSTTEKAVGLVGPVLALAAVVLAVAAGTGADPRLSLGLSALLALSVSSAIGAIYLALRLVAHRDAARGER